ncbi:hypothetical protein QFC21_001509 [Naganishia friedmannii]|uniref:Uncharacterized protein n=1 Tax=Naganishia friedmannii TaxID=89922 RepID=A0ACC2W4N1_9TREE|nr:hypothetical protein QFC21_001509 [Naganishia friedmannii]
MPAKTVAESGVPALKRLASASKSCSVPSLAYGKCIGASYLDVSKGMCEKEFQAFKECVQVSVGGGGWALQ